LFLLIPLFPLCPSPSLFSFAFHYCFLPSQHLPFCALLSWSLCTVLYCTICTLQPCIFLRLFSMSCFLFSLYLSISSFNLSLPICFFSSVFPSVSPPQPIL
jgi:hypothetical protein